MTSERRPQGELPRVQDLFAAALRHHQTGQLAEAERLYRKIITADAPHADALHLLGVIAQQRGQNDSAIDLIGRAIAIDGAAASYYSNLGVALNQAGRLCDAVSAFRSALLLSPGYLDAQSNLGATLSDLGRYEPAVAIYGSALRIKPDLVEVQAKLGVLLANLGCLDSSMAATKSAITIKPDSAEAHCRQGIALLKLGRPTPAAAALRAALRIRPDYAEAYSNLGNALQDSGRLQEAIDAYGEALRTNPGYANAHSNLLFSLNNHATLSSDEIYRAHRRWGERYGAMAQGHHANERSPKRRLRVGYVSPDFCLHSVAYFFEPLLQVHDRSLFEIYCYAEVAQPDQVTKRLKVLTDKWCSTVGMTDADLVRRISEDGIDILVDLAGHTANNRLRVFAAKPAPIQMTWLGYPNTTGLQAMDYRLVDAVTDPNGVADGWSSERLLRLEDGFLCYGPPADAPEPALPPVVSRGFITFGSFNNPAKLSDPTLDAWAKLLVRVSGSRLLLKGRPFADAGTRALFAAKLAERGVASDRITLQGRLPDPARHLQFYSEVDIALDPFPYNGTTTTCEALWMGVPVVTLAGERHAGRVGASLLCRLGLDAFIARTKDDYVTVAAGLAADIVRLSELRSSLRTRMAASALCDAPGFARKLEAAYRTIWEAWCPARSNTLISSQTITLVDGVRVVVPNSLDLITPYVLLEQRDWFEDEIKFLRCLLQAGQKVIDIGANYGVYALCMAQKVASEGQVWAFEPASNTAKLLAESIAVNGFSQIVLEQTALSRDCGTSRLSLSEHSELNALVRNGSATKLSETVRLETLDSCMERYGWHDIAFLKIDAEGEESNILEGGKRFFSELSPLIQFEIRTGIERHRILVKQFRSLGYLPYRLVPGLDLLVRVDDEEPLDDYLLNLFCCKKDRAERLAAQGLLVMSPAPPPIRAGELDDDGLDRGKDSLSFNWRHTIAKLPYGLQLGDLWQQAMADGDGTTLERALSRYSLSQDLSRTPAERFHALSASFALLRLLCDRQPSPLRHASLARVAKDFGARKLAVKTLQALVNAVLCNKKQLDWREPFLAPAKRFDSIAPGESLRNWLLASAQEELETLEYFSSFYSGASSWQRLQNIKTLGFGSPEMDRRLHLMRERFDALDLGNSVGK